jgi:hypothetical protein
MDRVEYACVCYFLAIGLYEPKKNWLFCVIQLYIEYLGLIFEKSRLR